MRINRAHDSQPVWEAMIANVRRAEQITRRSARVRILMDLAGPKVRTILPKDAKTRVTVGDTPLTRDVRARGHDDGILRLGCTLEEVYDQLRLGDQSASMMARSVRRSPRLPSGGRGCALSKPHPRASVRPNKDSTSPIPTLPWCHYGSNRDLISSLVMLT